MERVRRAFRYWLAIAFAWSLALAVMLAVQHQLLRLQADDPQVQMAEDAAARLAAGGGPEAVLPPGGDVAIEHSLAPWLLLYDASGTPLAGTGRLHGALPRMPGQVLPYAREHGGHRLSWQPEAGVRQALVIVPLRSGGQDRFVLAGRSLREAEQRKRQVLRYLALLWGLGLVALAAPALLLSTRRD